MRRLVAIVAPLALALAAGLPPAASAQTKAKAPTVKPPPKPANAKRAPVSSRGLETILQDDGLLLYRPQPEVEAAVARMRELGVDRVRITASWSSLTRMPEEETKPRALTPPIPAPTSTRAGLAWTRRFARSTPPG
jgi:hypothetical protein